MACEQLSDITQAFVTGWQQTLAGVASAREQWHTVEGDGWGWQPDGAVVHHGAAEWSALGWYGGAGILLPALRNVVIELSVSGNARAAGISFGPYKDFLAPLEPGRSRRLQLEIDAAAGCWTFRVDGELMPRTWWDAQITGVNDLLNGVFTLKAHAFEQVHFHDLALHSFVSSCKLSVIIVCYRFVQRLRITLRNWCYQELPAGAYEVLVVNPGSPDGTHEYLATVARSFPHVRVREVPAPPALANNKGRLVNYGVQASRGAWTWLTDADCLFAPGSAAAVLSYIRQRQPRLFYAERRHLSQTQTDALLAGRIDGLRDFAALAGQQHRHRVEHEPWGYTQIIPRYVMETIPYQTQVTGYDGSDQRFVEACKQRGILPEPVPGLFCLHLDHPFAWHGTTGFL